MTKSFDERLNKQFQCLSIESPKTARYIEHIYADFIELHALFLKEEITLADISDKLKDVHDQNLTNMEVVFPDDPNEIASLTAEKNDIIEGHITSIFSICEERSLLYELDEYPFQIQRNIIKLKNQLTSKQKLYLFLLLCSSINYFKMLNTELTMDFEILSYQSLKSFLPPKAIIKAFGKDTDYVGNAKSKITLLAQELGVDINSKKIDEIPVRNTQERGLDIIGWIPFKDKIPNMLLLLCQCACGKDWSRKQYDTQRFKEYFHFDKTPIHAMFVPYSIGKLSENKFHQHDEILSDHIFFDRKRIIEQIENLDFFKNLPSIHIVEKSISDRILV